MKWTQNTLTEQTSIEESLINLTISYIMFHIIFLLHDIEYLALYNVYSVYKR